MCIYICEMWPPAPPLIKNSKIELWTFWSPALAPPPFGLFPLFGMYFNSDASLTRCFSFSPRSPKLIFKTGNRIIQTGNGIISLTSWPLIKRLLPQDFFSFLPRISKLIFNRKQNYSNRKWNNFSIFQASVWSKYFSFLPKAVLTYLSSVHLFWPIWSYLDVSWPTRISLQPMQHPTCYEWQN